MCACAIEHYEGALQTSPLLYAGKKSQLNYPYQCCYCNVWLVNQSAVAECERHDGICINQ